MILKDCLEIIIDNRGRNPKYYDNEAYPVIDNVMIKNNYHPNIKEATRFINQDTHDNFLRGYLEPNIPIMTLVGGGIGNVSLAIDDKSVIVQNTIGFKTKAEILDSVYLYYWFLYKHDELIQFNRGSGQPSIRKTDIENMNIELKNINYQRKVSKILSKIDEKIALNNEINNNLYEFAINYLNEKVSSNEIPVSKFAKIQGGYAFKSKDLIDTYTNNRIIKIKNLQSKLNTDVINTQFVENAVVEKLDNKFKLSKGNVVIAMTGAELGKTGFIYGNDNYYLNQRVGVIKGNDEASELYLNIMFLSEEFQTLLNSKGYGSAQPNVSTSDIENIMVNDISEYNLNDFYKKIKPVYKKIISNSEEIHNLEQLRDTLLPKLMNGEIDLDNIEI